MVLTYAGGVVLPQRTDASRQTGAVMPHAPGEVYLAIEPTSTLTKNEGDRVQMGEAVAFHRDETPVYSSANGRFDGVYEAFGSLYVKVTVDPEDDRPPLASRDPETQELSQMDHAYLLNALRQLGIWDMQSGDWLWRRAEKAIGKTRRVVLDTTDDNGYSFTGYRTVLRDAGAVLGGAKILLHLLGASKIILVTDRNRRKAADALHQAITDPELIAEARLNVKYPVREETLYEAIYAKPLGQGMTADAQGVFILRAQTAEAIYRAMCSGVPQLTRWLSVAGDGFAKTGVFQIPLGAPWSRLLEIFGKKKGNCIAILDSPLKSIPAEGVLGGKTEGVLCDKAVKKQSLHCIACGRCAEVCPMWLRPYEILSERVYRDVKRLSLVCIDCGCCDYICPSGLPLRSLIARYRSTNVNSTNVNSTIVQQKGE